MQEAAACLQSPAALAAAMVRRSESALAIVWEPVAQLPAAAQAAKPFPIHKQMEAAQAIRDTARLALVARQAMAQHLAPLEVARTRVEQMAADLAEVAALQVAVSRADRAAHRAPNSPAHRAAAHRPWVAVHR